MRALVVGQLATLAEVTFALESAQGTLPGTVGRVDNAFDALDLLDGSDPTILFLEVESPDDPQLFQISALRAKGARVIIVGKEPSAELRVAAIKAGARDVLFQPWTAARVRSRVAGVGTSTGSVPIGAQVDYRAIVLPEGTQDEIAARVKSLSPAGFMAETGRTRLGRDALIRVAIQVPAPHRLPVLFARSMVDSSGGNSTFRFVGLTADEESLLYQVIVGANSDGGHDPARPAQTFDSDGATRVATMPDVVNPADARAAIGRVIADLDASVLREVPSKWLGLALPVLTDAERLSLVNDGPLSEVAVWRTRAHVVASILEAAPSLATEELPFEEWRHGLSLARARIRTEVSLRVTEGDPARLRETREVQARLNAVSDRIDRIARESGIAVASEVGPLEAPSAPAVFLRPPPIAAPDSGERPASTSSANRRPGRTLLLASLVVLLLAGAMPLRMSATARRTRDIGREGVAQRPIAEAAGVRIRTVFREPNRSIVVVDRTWYDQRHDASPESAESAARVIARSLGVTGRVTLRDYAGRRLADIDGAPVVPPVVAGTAGNPSTVATGAPSPAATSAKTPAPHPSPRAKKPPRGPASPSR